MSTISDKLIQIKNIKQDIKEAINTGGGSVGDDFSTYPGEVSRLLSYENPNFYDIRTQNGTNFDNLFRGYNGPDIDVSQWDTSKVTSAQYCFSECTKSMDISNWDLSSLTNASRMFDDFTNNNTYLDLSVLDFSNVSKVSYMFGYSNTDYLDVRNINLTGSTNYGNLFDDCSGTELDLSNWDISGVTSLYYSFSSAGHKKINLTGWNTVNVKNMYFCFNSARNLETLIIPDWDMTNTTSTSYFLSSNPKLNYIDLSRSNDLTINKIASFLPTKTATTFGDILVPADTSQDAIDALIAKYWKPIGPKLDLISTELAFELDEIKPGKTTKVCNGNSDPWYGDDRLETIEFISSDESVATVNGRVITSTGVEGTTDIIARRRDTQEVISTAPITLTVSETDNYPNLIKFRTDGSEGTNGILIVNGTGLKASNLTYDSVTGIYSYDPGTQITSIKFYYSVSYHAVNEIVKFNLKAVNITNADSMFTYYQGTTLDLSDWDTSNVTSMRYMFSTCPYLTEIKGEIDCSNIDGCSAMFSSCPNLETVYLKNIFKNSTIINSKTFSINLGTTKVKDECLLYIINELPNLYDKGITNNTDIVFTLPKTNTLTAEQVQVAIDKGWIVANITYEVNE